MTVNELENLLIVNDYLFEFYYNNRHKFWTFCFPSREYRKCEVLLYPEKEMAELSTPKVIFSFYRINKDKETKKEFAGDLMKLLESYGRIELKGA